MMSLSVHSRQTLGCAMTFSDFRDRSPLAPSLFCQVGGGHPLQSYLDGKIPSNHFTSI